MGVRGFSTLMYLGSCVVSCSIFYPIWILQCSRKWKASSHLLTVKSGITRCRIKAEHKPSLVVRARCCQKRRNLHWVNCSAVSECCLRKGLGPGLVRKTLLWSTAGAGPDLGQFCLTVHLRSVLRFLQQNTQWETTYHGLKGMMGISFWFCREPERCKIGDSWRYMNWTRWGHPLMTILPEQFRFCQVACPKTSVSTSAFQTVRISAVPGYKGLFDTLYNTLEILHCCQARRGLHVLHSASESNTDWRRFYLQLCIALKMFRFLNTIANLEGFLAALVWRS